MLPYLVLTTLHYCLVVQGNSFELNDQKSYYPVPPVSEHYPKEADHEKEVSVHEAEWVEDFHSQAGETAEIYKSLDEHRVSESKEQLDMMPEISSKTTQTYASHQSSDMQGNVSASNFDAVDPTINGNIITDKDAISKEIQRIDEAIANIDSAINTSSFSGNSSTNIFTNNEAIDFLSAKEQVSSENTENLENKDNNPTEVNKEVNLPVSENGNGNNTSKNDVMEIDTSERTDTKDNSHSQDDMDIRNDGNFTQEDHRNNSGDENNFKDTETNMNDAHNPGDDQKGEANIEAAGLDEEGSKELLDKFKRESTEYIRHEPQPSDTRRMFDHPAETSQFKVASLARLRIFAKRNRMNGNVSDKENVCGKRQATCDSSSRYRSFDGLCNNLENPDLGATVTPFRRLLRPAYGDGQFLPRGVTEYTEERGYVSSLPSPRKISDIVLEQGPEGLTESKTNTHMVMQVGQFISHDMMKVAREAFDCCAQEIRNLDRCFPIDIPADDSFYTVFGKKCLDFTRSDTHCRSTDVAEQFNLKSAFIDGSVIYGDTEEFARKLRSKEGGGRLNVNKQLKDFLPNKFELKIKNSEKDKPTDFVAGDKRVETQATLTAMHNLFLNEHNMIADVLFKALKGKKGKSDTELDEFVFQETRRLVIAEIQNVVYQHFLPKVLGSDVINKMKILAKDCVYDPKADPTITNSFAAAAFRFGHSLVQSIFRGENQPWRLGKFYSDSRFARGHGGQDYKNELIGLSKQPCQKVDVHITKQMTQLLFCNNETRPGGGHDIGSINIQRGRDHGLPGYNEFRKFCGFPPIQDLHNHPPNIDSEAWSKISSVYKSIEDVDLFVGGLAELPPKDGLVGETFGCLISKQFKALMDGDRFFYHHTGGPNIFPLQGAALHEIESRTMGDIICEVTNVAEMPADVFVQNSEMVPCQNHRKLDLNTIARELEEFL